MEIIYYTSETICRKIEEVIKKLDEETKDTNLSDRMHLHAGAIGRIEGIIQNAQAQMSIDGTTSDRPY